MSRIYDSPDGLRPITGETLNDSIRPPLYSRQEFRDYLEPPASVEEEGLLRQAASAFRSHWIGFTVILTLCLTLAVVRTITKPPVYRAQALVEVMGLNQNFLNLRSMDPTNTSTEGE